MRSIFEGAVAESGRETGSPCFPAVFFCFFENPELGWGLKSHRAIGDSSLALGVNGLRMTGDAVDLDVRWPTTVDRHGRFSGDGFAGCAGCDAILRAFKKLDSPLPFQSNGSDGCAGFPRSAEAGLKLFCIHPIEICAKMADPDRQLENALHFADHRIGQSNAQRPVDSAPWTAPRGQGPVDNVEIVSQRNGTSVPCPSSGTCPSGHTEPHAPLGSSHHVHCGFV